MANIVGNTITTSTAAADQVICTGTPSAVAKLKLVTVAGYLTTWSATEANMGVVALRVGGVKKAEWRIQNTDNDTVAGFIAAPLGDGISFSGSEVVDVVVTPVSTTSMRWSATLWYDVA